VADPPADGVAEVGLNVAVTPDGSPETAKLTAELNPPVEVIVTVVVFEPVALTFRDDGDAEIVNSEDPVIVSVMSV